MVKHDRRRAAPSYLHVKGALKVPCPRCGAGAGFRCVKIRGKVVKGLKPGEDGSYQVRMTTVHRERKAKPSGQA